MSRWTGLLVAAALCAVPVLAFADAAGTAEGVRPASLAALDGNTRVLLVGSDVFIGDLIKTQDHGQVQIRFADNTELVISPNSELKIEDYLIRNDGSLGNFTVNMLAGGFRFATGTADHDRYQINTPTGTLAVRGTGFAVFVERITGETHILMDNGSVKFCTLTGVCDTLDDPCALGEILSAETVKLGDMHKITGPLRKEIRAEFLFAEDQSQLLRSYWMEHLRDCLINPPRDPSVLSESNGEGNGPAASSSSEEPSSQPPPSSSSSEQPSSSEPPSTSSESSDSSDPPDCDCA